MVRRINADPSAETPRSYTPLSLESLGVQSKDIAGFCDEANAWLNISIDPLDIRKSKITGNKPTEFLANTSGPGWFERYTLMLRLYLATGIEEILTNNVLNDEEIISNMNTHITKRNSDPKIFGYFSEKWRQLNLFQNMPARVLPMPNSQTDTSDTFFDLLANPPSDEPTTLFYRTINNIRHDEAHFFPWNKIADNIELIHMEVEEIKPRTEKLNEWWERINRLWRGGSIFEDEEMLLMGYQEEMIPGWTPIESDPRRLISGIGLSVGQRFGLDVIIDKQAPPKPMEKPKGVLRITYDDQLPALIPVSCGALHRIIYNLAKNTAKAKSLAEGTISLSPLEMDISVMYRQGNVLIAFRDNGPGFDLNVPLSTLTRIMDPIMLKEISRVMSPQVAKMLHAYVIEKHAFAPYPLTLKELFDLFLLRRVTGSIGKGNAEQTSGIGLDSIRAMLREVYGGEIFLTNHPDGGAVVLISFPIGDSAVRAMDLLQTL